MIYFQENRLNNRALAYITISKFDFLAQQLACIRVQLEAIIIAVKRRHISRNIGLQVVARDNAFVIVINCELDSLQSYICEVMEYISGKQTPSNQELHQAWKQCSHFSDASIKSPLSRLMKTARAEIFRDTMYMYDAHSLDLMPKLEVFVNDFERYKGYLANTTCHLLYSASLPYKMSTSFAVDLGFSSSCIAVKDIQIDTFNHAVDLVIESNFSQGHMLFYGLFPSMNEGRLAGSIFASEVFGGAYIDSLLVDTLRTKTQLTYNVTSFFNINNNKGLWCIYVEAPESNFSQVEDTIRTLLSTENCLVKSVKADCIRKVRNSELFDLDTPHKKLDRALAFACCGRSLSKLEYGLSSVDNDEIDMSFNRLTSQPIHTVEC
ncbi:insulinase family protein [Photobacterium damselae]|uniref:insulinase family protein n=1 Tax=Photobacterium damselae TaxID=38293 RepID=UPI002F405D34